MYVSMGPTGIYIYLTRNDLSSLGRKIILKYNRRHNKYEYIDEIEDAVMDILIFEDNDRIRYEVVYLDNTVREFDSEEDLRKELGDEIYSLIVRLTKRWLMLRKLLLHKTKPPLIGRGSPI